MLAWWRFPVVPVGGMYPNTHLKTAAQGEVVPFKFRASAKVAHLRKRPDIGAKRSSTVSFL
jgi:hypothetical protein